MGDVGAQPRLLGGSLDDEVTLFGMPDVTDDAQPLVLGSGFEDEVAVPEDLPHDWLLHRDVKDAAHRHRCHVHVGNAVHSEHPHVRDDESIHVSQIELTYGPSLAHQPDDEADDPPVAELPHRQETQHGRREGKHWHNGDDPVFLDLVYNVLPVIGEQVTIDVGEQETMQ